MPIINRSYFDAAQKGRDAAQQEQSNALINQGRQLDVAQGQYVNNLMRDPNTTPEQFARAGRSDVGNTLLNIQRAPAQDQAKQVKAFATQMTTAIRYAKGSKNPKSLIEQQFPMLVQAFGPQWATATDDQVRQELDNAEAKFGSMAGIAPQAPVKQQLINGVGPDGKPVRIEDAPGVTPYFQPQKGVKVTGPDGTEIQIGGDGAPDYAPQEFGKATRTNLEKAFVDAQGNAYALRAQLSKYRDEFSTAGGRVKAGIAGVKDYMGMENAPQQQQYLSEFTSWKADTASLLSQYLNQLSGAAISPAEEARLKAGFPNSDDGPTVYRSKAEATMRKFSLVQARAAYLLSSPGMKLDSVSLEGMSNIIAVEANKLATSLERGGMNPDQARQKALADTQTRFGMGQ